jgi:hypothetical protein
MPTQVKGIDFTGNSVKLNRFTALDLEAKKTLGLQANPNDFINRAKYFDPQYSSRSINAWRTEASYALCATRLSYVLLRAHRASRIPLYANYRAATRHIATKHE